MTLFKQAIWSAIEDIRGEIWEVCHYCASIVHSSFDTTKEVLESAFYLGHKSDLEYYDFQSVMLQIQICRSQMTQVSVTLSISRSIWLAASKLHPPSTRHLSSGISACPERVRQASVGIGGGLVACMFAAMKTV